MHEKQIPYIPEDCQPAYNEVVIEIEASSKKDSEGRQRFWSYWRTNYLAGTGEYSPDFKLTKAQSFFGKVEEHSKDQESKGKKVRLIQR